MDTLPPTGELTRCGDGEASFEPRPGMVLADRYELLEPIGRGATGWVWKARHVMIGKSFAIKLLATPTGAVDDEAAIRMLREANTLSRVEHPNVISVTDFGHARQGGTPFIVMELLQGLPLRAVLDARRLAWRQARVWGIQILEGVEAAHDEGIVHRDLKAANLFVTAKDDRIKVLDFGLARSRRPVSEGAEGHITAVPGIAGTPSTMSPEQIAGEQADVRSDLYSVGCVLYEMIAGRPPVEGSPAEILYQHVYATPTPLRELAPAEVPDRICAVIDECLRKEPNRRPASVRAVREAFDLRSRRRQTAVELDSAPASSSIPSTPPARSFRWANVVGAAATLSALFALVAASRPEPATAISTISVQVPALPPVTIAAPSLHAELPVFVQARRKQPATEAAPPPSRPAHRPRKAHPAPAPTQPGSHREPPPAVEASPRSGLREDPENAELKNPFAP